MFGTIRKHQKWLWIVIITLTIISFVIFFSPYSNLNDRGGGRANFGSINGERISQEDFIKARSEVFLRSFCLTGRWPDDEAKRGGQLERDIYQWMLMIQKLEQFGIQVSSDMAGQVGQGMIAALQRAKVIPSREAFLQQVLPSNGFKLEDFERFVRHYVGVQELVSTLGLSGKLVTPQEARELFKRENEELAAAAVFFSASNYLASVTVLPDAVTQFYSNRLATYRLPERVQVNYVKFELTNFLAEANAELARMTNLDLQIEAAYRDGGTNFLREVEAQSLDEAKRKIRDANRKQAEAQAARRKAADFANPLFNLDPLRAEDLSKMAKENGLAVGLTEPFDRENPPADLGVALDFAQKAFARTPDDPFAGPIQGSDAVYVIALNKKIPSEVPPLEQIRPQVVSEYRYSQALILARQAGADFYQTLTNGLAQGKTPAAIAAAAKLKLTDLPPFSLSTRLLPEVERHLNLNQFKHIAFSTSPGKVSDFQMTPDGGVILYVKSKLPLDEAKITANLPDFVGVVRQRRQNEAFNDWFRREAEKGLRDTPLARQEPPTMTPAPPSAKKS
ncbi:MAG TPA: peptidylprolyl isomerase [Candidatus Paceibacterota bacterium]|nr:peptidylprolyl isomerase [Verrucomicrobiota bacterium]HSA09181.1 peptidylprolyl isomerase [Candidatus Paceibacterota bacterium]